MLMIGMLFLILGVSSQDGTANNGFTKELSKGLEGFLKGMGSYSYNARDINLVIRKLAHFAEYMIFAMLLAVGLQNITNRLWPALLVSPLICFGVAYLDEWLQGYAISRTSSLFDVLVDGAGALAGLAMVVLVNSLTIWRRTL